MKLLKYENYQVFPTEEAFLVKKVRDLYNADKSADKEKFMQQLSYIYFMADPRSPYAEFSDEEKLCQLKQFEGFSKTFSPTKALIDATEDYKRLTTTTSMRLLNSMRAAIQKIGDFLEQVDLFEEDEKGKPKYNADRIAAMTDKVPNLAKKLIETEKIVDSEILEVGRARGGNDSKKVFEDGF